MEANAFTPIFTFILEVEENKYGVKDNDVDPTNSIVVVTNNCWQRSHIALGVATRGDSIMALGSGKVSGLKQQARFKQTKSRLKLHF